MRRLERCIPIHQRAALTARAQRVVSEELQMPSADHENLVTALLTAPVPEEEPTLAQTRAGFDGLIGSCGRAPDVAFAEVGLAGVPALQHEVEGSPAHLLWVHGGGMVVGCATAYANPLSWLFPDCSATIVDFRRAPEEAMPAQLDDVVAVYRELVRNAGPASIVIGGDSAGGGLALLAAITLRDAGDPAPAGLVLVSPWTDYELGDQIVDRISPPDPLLSRETLAGMTAAFADGRPVADWSPAARDLAGLPPTHVEFSTRDITCGDSQRLIGDLRMAGVTVTSSMAEDLIHVYPILLPHSPEGGQAAGRMRSFIHTRSSKEER
jgi:acetyl esterase/lipase